ncbi:MAG: vitamin B12-dependent ribonucleotide reductase [Gemmatimonadetes bacterium]|nr:vitamin B12-dependent ribonucleotide reductase [Gemmatimonadota bacterium]
MIKTHAPRPPREIEIFNDLTPPDLPEASFNENARTVLALRYLKKDENGEPTEEPETMFWRIARTIADVDADYGASADAVEELARQFYGLMTTGAFEPNSPTLMNAGRPLGQLSACFVLPVDDALSTGEGGIYDTLTSMALVHQSGGGTGFSFSRLRPEGSMVRSTMGVASGPVSFMRLYDASTDVVKQGGTRRGANMGILRVDHPDIRKFINCKNDTSQITNFNISVAITDAFMAAVAADEQYELVDPTTGACVGTERARAIFDEIVHSAWRTGEPGTFFIDRANEHNPVPALGSYEATNPCGEQPLLPYDVCNLGSVNVGAYVKDGTVDWDGLRRTVHLSIRFLDNVIDANRYPLPQIHERSQEIRRVGLGVMGWADMLVRLGIPYDSEEGVAFGERLMEFVNEESRVSSEKLAESRGVFPAWRESVWGPDDHAARNQAGGRIRDERRLRNCNLTTIAPTGTISIFAGCSGGIEPLFAVAFMRNQAGVLMPDVNPDFVARAKAEGWFTEELMDRVAKEGHIHFDEIPEETQRIFRTAHDITPEWHVRMQAAFQMHNDSAISKTTNFPREAAEKDVREIYSLAYSLGCKGVTVYRDGSRDAQVLSTGKTETAAKKPSEKEADAEPPANAAAAQEKAWETLKNTLADTRERLHNKEIEIEALRARLAREDVARGKRRRKRVRPQVLHGYTVKMNSPLGDIYVSVNEDEEGRPFEVFCTIGKAGGAATADAEAVGRLASLALRSGIPLTEVKEQLRGISCDRAVGLGPNKVLSVPDAVGQAIDTYLAEKEGVQESLPLTVEAPAWSGSKTATATAATGGGDSAGPAFDLSTCPECKAGRMAYVEGCKTCHICGYSDCS